MHIGVKATAQILNIGENTDMTRGWDLGRSPGGDIWPRGTKGEPVKKKPKRDQKKLKFFFFKVFKTFF